MNKFVFLFIFLSSYLFGQKQTLKIFDSSNSKLITKNTFTDSLTLINFTNDFIFRKNLNGYISAHYDSIYSDTLANYYYFLNSEKKYFWKKISFNIPDYILRKASVKKRTFEEKK